MEKYKLIKHLEASNSLKPKEIFFFYKKKGTESITIAPQEKETKKPIGRKLIKPSTKVLVKDKTHQHPIIKSANMQMGNFHFCTKANKMRKPRGV